MPSLYSAAALTVAAVYCVWHAWAQARARQQQVLCRRVAYMLWVVAGAGDDPGVAWHGEDYGYHEE